MDKRIPLALAAGGLGVWAFARRRRDPNVVNDVHAKLNPTRVVRVVRPGSLEAAVSEVRAAAREGRVLCASGSRHAMGGQQFAAEATLIDARGLNRVIDFDSSRGLVEVGGGIEWPRLVQWLLRQGKGETWTIRQRPTG